MRIHDIRTDCFEVPVTVCFFIVCFARLTPSFYGHNFIVLVTVVIIIYCKIRSNSNSTVWSTIQGVIARVISKSDEREARGRFKAETNDATNRCDTSPRQVAATNRLVRHVKIILARDLSHEFKLV